MAMQGGGGVAEVDYDLIPVHYHFELVITDTCHFEYGQLLQDIRILATAAGEDFEGIRNLNVAGDDYGFIEIEGSTPAGTSVRFIMKLSDLYIVAFGVGDYWYQYDGCHCKFRGFSSLGVEGSYSDLDEISLGPESMRAAIADIFVAFNRPFEQLKDVAAFESLRSAQVFFVHLAEACRYFPVEALIRSCLGQPTRLTFGKPPMFIGDDQERYFQEDRKSVV